MEKSWKKFLIVFSFAVLVLFVVSACASGQTLAGKATATGVQSCKNNPTCNAAFTACDSDKGCSSTYSASLDKCKKLGKVENLECVVVSKKSYKSCVNGCYDSAINAVGSTPLPGPVPTGALKQKVKCEDVTLINLKEGKGYGMPGDEMPGTGDFILEQKSGYDLCQWKGYDTCSVVWYTEVLQYFTSTDSSCSGQRQIYTDFMTRMPCGFILKDYLQKCEKTNIAKAVEPLQGDFQRGIYADVVTCCKLE